MSDQWSESDQAVLLEAICRGVNTAHIIEIAIEETAHTEQEIRKRLIGMGVIDEE
ncbi:hypothetical protein [Vibrio mediterranei]|uniref:hypothetical protein n=1 Tax=Vibrio mediterranei TaxID=689 RepID=UPI0040693592